MKIGHIGGASPGEEYRIVLIYSRKLCSSHGIAIPNRILCNQLSSNK